MANIISFAERRNAKLRDRLTKFAVKGEPVIIETGSGLIRGDHLTCHSHAAEILNSWGEKVVVSYGDIRDVRPAVTPQLSTISDHGDFVVPTGLAARD